MNKEISQQFSKGNFGACYQYFADNIEWNIIGAAVVKGKEHVIAHCEKMLVEMADSSLNNTTVIAENNSVAVEGYCNFTDEDNKPGIVSYCDVYRFDGEKIAVITSYCI